MKLPNKTHPDSPIGSEENNVIVKTVGQKPKSASGKGHLQIGEEFDLFDFQGASKVTGNKFVFLKNEAAILELALINWAMNVVTKKGFIPITTPDIARTPIVESCGFQPRDDAG